MDAENADVNVGVGTPLLTRSRPKMLTEAIAGMTDEQKRVVTEMGFGGLLKLTLKTIPGAFARYVVGLLDTDKMVLDTPKGKIPIDLMAVHEVLGFPLGNRQIMRRRVSNYNTDLANEWKSYSKESLELSRISIRIKETTTANRMFQVDFLILMATLMIIAMKNNKINREILTTLPLNFVSKEYDWCEYVVHAVRTCKRDWEPSKPESLFLGPLTFLMLLYCDRVCLMLESPVLRNRPVIAQWTCDDLRRRTEAEISSGAYGSCEFLVEWRKTSEAKEYRSKNIHFEECGCPGLEDDEDVTEVEDGEETTKEDDVNPSFLDKSEAGIIHSMTLLNGIFYSCITLSSQITEDAPLDTSLRDDTRPILTTYQRVRKRRNRVEEDKEGSLSFGR